MGKWKKRILLAVFGGAAGYAYFVFIGCASGACPITSSPYVSTAYGALMGAVLGWNTDRQKRS